MLEFLLGQLHSFEVLLALFLCLHRLLHGFFYPLRHFFMIVPALLFYTRHLPLSFFCLLNQDRLIGEQILVGSCQRAVFLPQSDRAIDFSVLSLRWREGLLQPVGNIFAGGTEVCAGYGNIVIWSLRAVQNQGTAVLSCLNVNHICIGEVGWSLVCQHSVGYEICKESHSTLRCFRGLIARSFYSVTRSFILFFFSTRHFFSIVPLIVPIVTTQTCYLLNCLRIADCFIVYHPI